MKELVLDERTINIVELEATKYSDALAGTATTLAMKYFAIVNFVCLPYDEFVEKKTWYVYFRNIDLEGEVLYG